MRQLRFLKALVLIPALVLILMASMPEASSAFTVSGNPGVYPPWNKDGNPSISQGYHFSPMTVDNNPDFHGNITAVTMHPKSSLVVFIGGNIFFVLPHVVKAFKKEYPAVKHVFYVTIPPGMLVRVWKHGDTVTLGNLTIHFTPDVYMAGVKKLNYTAKIGMTCGKISKYAKNNLAIMTYKGNPYRIKGLKDLGNSSLKLSMPNPAFEGIAHQIKASLVKAGGKSLEKSVYHYGVKSGRVYLTHIHHRQTPMRIMQKKSDAGVTWQSEAKFQQMIGNPISEVNIPAKYNTFALYGAAMMKGAPDKVAAKEWLSFLKSKRCLNIFKKYGFTAP